MSARLKRQKKHINTEAFLKICPALYTICEKMLTFFSLSFRLDAYSVFGTCIFVHNLINMILHNRLTCLCKNESEYTSSINCKGFRLRCAKDNTL